MTRKNNTRMGLKFSFISTILLLLPLSPEPTRAAYSSTQTTPIQNNTMQSQNADDCFNQSAATSNVQIYSGNGEVTQQRQRNVYQDTPNSPLEGTGINTPNVETHIDRPLAIPLPLNLINP